MTPLTFCLILLLAFTSAQQGQDYYYSNAGPAGYHVTLQQQQRQQQYTNNFYTNNGAPLATSYQNQPSQSHQASFQPSSYQLPPRSLQQYDPYQPFHTNQHLPQPFHHHVTATPQYDFQDQFFQSNKDTRSQNFYDVHPQGLIDQLDTGSRWRQTDSRKVPTPGPSVDSFVDQSVVNHPVSSTPVVYKFDEETKLTRVEPLKKKTSRVQNTINRENNLTTYRPRIAVSESELIGQELSEPSRTRSRNKNTRSDFRAIKPTTYTPSSTPSALNRQRSRYTRPNKDIKIESTTFKAEQPRTVRGRGTNRVNVNNFFTTSQTTTPSTTTLSPTVSSTTDPNAEYEFYDYELAPQNEADGPLSIDQLEANLGPPEALLRPNFNLRQNLDNASFYDVLRPFDDLNIPYDKEPKPVVDPYKLVREPSITTFRNKIATVSTTTTSTTSEPETEAYEETTPKPIENDQVGAPVNEDKDAPQPTESWVIVASVQTSRSVSGARFLPSDLIKQEEQPKPRTPNGGIERTPKTIEISTTKPSEDHQVENVELEVKDASFGGIHKSPASTESIIDKLDRVQSELSSGILGFRHGDNKLELEPLPDMTSDKIETTTTSATTTPTSATSTTTTPSTTTTESPTEGTPLIRKFVPANKRTTTTGKPSVKKSIFESIEFDELTPGLLPAGFKQRGFKPKTSRTTTAQPSVDKGVQNDDVKSSSREGSGRSTGGTHKNKIKSDDVNAFLPPGYKVSSTTISTTTSKTKQKSVADLFGKITFDDISALLPPGYKDKQEKFEKPEKIAKEEKKIEKKPSPKPVEIPANLLPAGFRPSDTVQEEKVESKNTSILDSLLSKVKFKNVESLLPPGYDKDSPKAESPESTTAKVVFPTRPGISGKTSPPRSPGKTKSGGGLAPVVPRINKGWPVRATTEFTGWPSPATTPMSISVQEILAAAKAAAASSTSTTTEQTTTTVTTTTTTTPRPTTPGICSEDACDMAATIRLVGSTAKWLPELGDHNTIEYQQMATDIENQLNIIYSSSESLSRWYKKITIDAFNPGSILVDYFVELSEIGKSVNTADMKRIFHDSLQKYTASQEALSNNLRSINSTVEFKLGRFTVDPKFTDFKVLPRRVVPTVGYAEEDELLPQWAIAVIVIGLASLLFVIIFGVTVLVNRHKGAKKKQPAGLTEDMLHELNKNHLGGLDNFGADDLYNMEDVWNEKPIKKRSSGSIQDNSMANLYDSWRSEWNGYYYNGYYGNGSSTSGYSRRRSDYDTNF